MNTLRLLIITFGLLGAATFYHYGRSFWVPVYQDLRGKQSLSSVIQTYGPAAEQRLKPYFQQAGVVHPPQQVRLLALKDQKQLELWADDGHGLRHIRNYPIQAASGKLGPKLREGDRQVPEGIYRISGLNPNSSYHLSMKLNYPNAFDLKQARAEGRSQPGSNIFIHGKALSIGCLAMGDPAIEELFTLVHKTGRQNAQVIISPSDPRTQDLSKLAAGQPDWVKELYADIKRAAAGLN